MSEVTIIGIDLAKRVFQLHGARHNGSVAFRKKLSRGQLLAFIAQYSIGFHGITPRGIGDDKGR
ncbi:transposase [Roseovarius sp. MBR-79]|jgi:transposase